MHCKSPLIDDIRKLVFLFDILCLSMKDSPSSSFSLGLRRPTITAETAAAIWWGILYNIFRVWKILFATLRTHHANRYRLFPTCPWIKGQVKGGIKDDAMIAKTASWYRKSCHVWQGASKNCYHRKKQKGISTDRPLSGSLSESPFILNLFQARFYLFLRNRRETASTWCVYI